MRRLGSQRQRGIALREGSRLCRRNRPAPFDQTVAVSARVAPPDAEERACPSFHQRERALAPDPDELLAERPLPLLADLALQAEQAPLGYLPGSDFVHDGPLSAQSVHEVVGELASRIVCRFGVAPVLG